MLGFKASKKAGVTRNSSQAPHKTGLTNKKTASSTVAVYGTSTIRGKVKSK